ncbi:hypothetical protein GON26_00335 [Flavobacterium sp. GA093]|uniref:Lipoprotein n=1 Tax=Flavobacterium hydrocarbonoxydans TaxID=2683249 RepID=A0A6I4NJ52_9FLAO|nr:hypothetical protein [Flavobacterium hydrocarbonoxydans]MWB92802.1 hypothetical protein [Flavobacterium hydrocarbonoxydans]
MKIKYFLILTTLFFLSCKTIKPLVKEDDVEITDIEKHYLLSDSSSEKYYLIMLIRKLQFEKKLGEIPMVIVDGDPKYYFYKEETKALNVEKNKITKIKILEAEKCVETFGAACKYGLVTISTFGTQEELP